MNDQLAERGKTAARNSGLLTCVGAETVYDTTVTINFEINGIIYQLAAVTDGTTPTSDANGVVLKTLTASQCCAIVWAVKSDGTVGVFQGPILSLDQAGAIVPCPFPDIADGWCPFAYQILKAASTAGTITFGSSNWNATGFTNTIANVGTMPTRPQTA